MREETGTNKMGTMSVNRLMLSMGIPMVISMVLQAFYNIVDSAFVSNMEGVGEAALNALTLAFPIQILMVAVSVGTGVGVNALLSRSLGEGNREKASQAAGNGIFLSLVIYLAFLVFGLFGVKTYLVTQTRNTQILEMAEDYLRICCIVSFGIVFFPSYEKQLQATGRALYSTIAQIAGALVNIIFDPILIYGWLGFREYGVKGAAYATVAGQIVSFLAALLFHLKCNKEISNGVRYMKPSAGIIREIYAIGLPAIVSQALLSVMTYGLNLIFGNIDEAVVTAYGLYYKIQQFILFAAFGLRDAITPIVSFNYGMGNRKRVRAGMKYGLIDTLVIMAAGMAVLEIFARPLAAVFGLSGQTQELCIGAMRMISLSFLFAGVNIAMQGIFQALEGGIESLVISLCRQFLFVLPVAWFFSLIAKQSADKVWLVWVTFPLAEIVSAVIAVLFLARIIKTRVDVLED